MVEYIYYTGIGSKKNGKHSVKEFLDIMNKKFNIECSEFLTDLDYKPCGEYKEMDRKTLSYNIKHNKPLFNYNMTKFKTNGSKKYKNLVKKCNQYKKTAKQRKCNLEEYINFVGAEKK